MYRQVLELTVLEVGCGSISGEGVINILATGELSLKMRYRQNGNLSVMRENEAT
jgi:hypothetical protein